MSFERAWAGLLVLTMAFGGGQAAAEDVRRPVVLVMESSLGVGGAARVRAALRQRLGIGILSGSEAGGSTKPRALLAVALDRAQTVTVVYVDERGQSDTLSAPVVGVPADITTLVAMLAGALLEKHLDSEKQAADSQRERAPLASLDVNTELMNASRALYGALGRLGGLPRRTGRLSPEDF